MTKQRETREQVLELIEALEVGDAIPSERLLSHDLGVSRLTLRAALDELVREGRLTRRRGSGTFVAEPKVAKGMGISSFSDDMRLRGLTPGSRTLSSARFPPGRGSAASSTSRRRNRCSPSSGYGSPTASRWPSSSSTSPRACSRGSPPTTSRKAPSTTCSVIRYGIEIVGGTQTVEPTVTGEEESESSVYRSTHPHFSSSASHVRRAGETVEFTSSIYRGDRYRLVSELGTAASPPCRSGSQPARSTASPELCGQYQPRGLRQAFRTKPLEQGRKVGIDITADLVRGSRDNEVWY